MTLKILAPAVVLALCTVSRVASQGLLEDFAEWNFLEFENNTAYPSFVRENGIFTGIQVSQSKVFVTIPRLRPGTPVTLATLSKSGTPSDKPKLQPFPSASWQHGYADGCQSLVSVFRSRLDPCGRLWVLDTGSVNALSGFRQLCPPKLVVFNEDGTESLRVIIPPGVLRSDSLLVALALDRRGTGRLQTCPQTNQMVVYISDLGSGVIVFDYQSQTFWRHEHPSFVPEPQFANHTINGEQFHLSDGILGMAVGVHQLTKVLYYQPLASRSLYAIQTVNLMTPGIANLNSVLVFERASESAGLVADGMSRLFYSEMQPTDLREWNPILSRFRTIASDSERLQFVSDLAVDNQGSLWIASVKFQSYLNGRMCSNATNMRILRIPRAANVPFYRLR